MKTKNLLKKTFLLLALVGGAFSAWAAPATSWSDISIDLRSGQLGTSGSNMSKYVTVGSPYAYADEDPGSYNAILFASSWNGSDHGYVNLKATVPLKAGIYKITLGTCAWGSNACVKNSEESTLNVIDVNGETVTGVNQNNGTCYHNNTTENVVSMWYTASSDETITIVCGNYTPYFAIEKVNSVPELKYSVTYAKGDGVEGTVPSVEYVTSGNSITLPVNYTLYKSGYTLTGWNDGSNIYATGASYTVTKNTTMTAVFTANGASSYLGHNASTVTWGFQTANDDPTWNLQGFGKEKIGYYVTKTSVGGSNIDLLMTMDVTNGKIDNSTNSSWAQINANTILTVPVIVGAVVKVYTYSSAAAPTFDGNTGNFDSTNKIYSYTATTAGDLDIVFGGDDYASQVTVEYPLTVSVTVSDAGYATYVNSDYDLNFTSTSIKAYKVKVTSKGVATMTLVNKVPANTPVLLYKDGGATESIPSMTGAAAVTENDLVAGADAAVPTEDGAGNTNMILNNIGGNVGFYFAAGNTVATNRAYLHFASTLAPGAGEARGMTLVLDDNILTGINEVEAATKAIVKEGKFFENGKLVIFKRGMKFNANGQVIK